MNNNLSSLNNYLFESLERINDDELTEEELDKEIKRAEIVNKIGNTIIENARTQLAAVKFMAEYDGASIEESKKTVTAMLETKS